MLEIKDLTLAYGVNPVVRNINVTVEEGQIFAVLGPNGAGKSSILRAVSGLKAAESGDIIFSGSSILGLSPHAIVQKGVSQVPEGRHIFSEMSVLDNLLIGATVHIQDRARVNELLERNFELFPILRERINQAGGTLSGGEQQQLAIGRGLMANPRLLLVDEPTLGLAPIVIKTVGNIFERLPEMEITAVVAEQNADFALKIADCGAVISGGEISFGGDVETLRSSDEVRRAYLGS